MIIGYARVSTTDQTLGGQIDDLLSCGCERVYSEQVSGTSRAGRTQLAECLASLKAGDILMVTKIDRLARNLHDFVEILNDLEERLVAFQAIMQGGIDTTTTYGRLVVQILASVAEFEAEMISERRREGIERAKAAGKYVTANHQAKVQMVGNLLALGEKPADIARKVTEAGYPISERTVYRYYEDTKSDYPVDRTPTRRPLTHQARAKLAALS